jgi:hypothetical protein
MKETFPQNNNLKELKYNEELETQPIDNAFFEVDALAYKILKDNPELGFEKAQERAVDLIKRYKEEELENL